MRTLTLITIAILFTVSCKNEEPAADAFGNFEATEVIVSAETSGRILAFKPAEGSQVSEKDILAVIDTTLLKLQESEIDAGMRSIRTRLISVDAQNEILRQQIENLKINLNRTENMLSDGAATQKQLDDLKGQELVLLKQIEANNTQKTSIAAELAVYETKKGIIREQLTRCKVLSPLAGTIIQKYAEEGEITAAGKPLVKIADLTHMELKVYVSGAQLSEVKIGAGCTVRIDQGEKNFKTFQGKISFVSGKAEFTPKIIQTKEERVTLVYAVKIDVPNDGSMKAGMPGEAIF